MTFSICVQEESDAGTVYGVAVTTDAPAVGALAPYVSSRGAVSTQAFVNVRLGRRGIALLEDVPLEQALSGVLERDDHSELRQLHGVADGDVFAYTGDETDSWSGDETYPEAGVTVAGNMLAGPEALPAAADAFLATEPADAVDAGLVPRLIDALAAGVEVGGDKRGHSSAAVCVSAPKTTAYHDLRVDHADDPIAEIRRVYETAYDASDGFSEDSKERIFD
ncbi:DUF1028 domain-containing protein [Halorubrum sp. 48-1-W]|uniref:DUF1028 domain-containing protein n=1 Tax=Halorubrum sp. 48-1-W TaxID=2249761 RepID=UPI000DCBD8EF|nr:DUF1028 domain-containing protein [Halorubrum sp. 48-1-W]RAW46124.1 DUF1028 domain-containing protein [Halorubrum sp. 48-1-W]